MLCPYLSRKAVSESRMSVCEFGFKLLSQLVIYRTEITGFKAYIFLIKMLCKKLNFSLVKFPCSCFLVYW